MTNLMQCIAIDDDHLFLEKIKEFLNSNENIELIACYDNPIKGATAIMTENPDLVLLDLKMPYMDGVSLLEWMQPKIRSMKTHPTVVFISSFEIPKAELGIAKGYLQKRDVIDPETFNKKLNEIVFGTS